MPDPIIVNNFQSGIAPSQILGHASIIGDVSMFQGSIRPNIRLATQGTFTNFINWFANDTLHNVQYAVDLGGKVYKRVNGTWSNLSSQPSTATSGLIPFTANSGTNELTITSNTEIAQTGTQVILLAAGGTMPEPLVDGGLYFVVRTSNTIIRLATSYLNAINGTVIDLTTNGSGTLNISTLTARGQGIVVYKNYLWVFRNSFIDIYGPLTTSGGGAWTTSAGGGSTQWSGGAGITNSLDNDGNYHPSLVGQDDILYIGAGAYIASVQEVSGQIFNPNIPATFVFTGRALDLPTQYRVRCLAELGVNLMIGTWVGASLTNTKIADVFPWDRTSPSFDIPQRLQENGVNAMVTKDNILYIVAGVSGKVFATNGTTIRQVTQIPNYISQLDGNQSLETFPGSIMVHLGRVWFGSSYEGGSGSHANGLWSYNIETSALVYEVDNGVQIGVGALYSLDRERYIVAYRFDFVTFGVFTSDPDSRSDAPAVVESQEFRSGTVVANATYTKLLVQLARPLATDEFIEIFWRESRTGSWVLIATFDVESVGLQALDAPANIENSKNVQLKANLYGVDLATSGPELMEIRLE